jgi:phosphoribosylamine--glycine ligase
MNIALIGNAVYDLIVLTRVENSANGLQQQLVNIFGPEKVFACSKDAARFETDKSYGLDTATKYSLNVPRTIVIKPNHVLDSDDVKNQIQRVKDTISGPRYVVKKTGLACGQGVKILKGTDELSIYLWLWAWMNDESVLVQEHKEGIEISGRVLCQQGEIIPLWMTMEHKMAYNDCRGPCTAEMGTVVLAGVGDPIMKEIQKLEPWLHKVNYTGMLDINFIMDTDGKLWFVEPTCRWGDPETEIALPMLDCDFAEIALKACKGEVSENDIVFAHKAAVGVVIAGGGYPYPDACLQGRPIELPPNDYPYVFAMGAEKEDGKLVTKGGRHLVVVGTGEFVKSAKNDAYRMVRSNYWFLDAWYRTDIGAKWEKQKPLLVQHGVIV